MADTHEKKIVAALEREVADEVGKEFLAEGHSPHSPEARAELAEREIAEFLAGRTGPSYPTHLISLRDAPFD